MIPTSTGSGDTPTLWSKKPKLKFLCQYMIICKRSRDCGHGCAHEGTPYEQRSYCIPHRRLIGCPKDIPDDRECIPLNLEEIVEWVQKNEPI